MSPKKDDFIFELVMLESHIARLKAFAIFSNDRDTALAVLKNIKRSVDKLYDKHTSEDETKFFLAE